MQKLSYKKLSHFQTPQSNSKLTNEQRFWKKYQASLFSQDSAPVNCICSNRNQKNIFIFGQGRKINIVDPIKKQSIRQVNSFIQNISAICIRPDGNVFAAADQAGKIEIMDVKQKFHLRTFKNHKKKVNALQYIQNDLYSAGDDFMIRHYDVASGQVVHSYDNAHSDYIKSLKALENNHILSGAYDGIVKLFDFRVHQKAQIEFKHEQPIESLDVFPSKLNFIVGGGNKVSIWDIRNGKFMFQGRNNKKLVSSVKVISNGSRYVTSSLDNYLKIFKSDTFELTYQEKYDAGILAFDITQNNQSLAIGIQGGKIFFKSRKKNDQAQTQESDKEIQQQIALWMKKNSQKTFAYNDKYFFRGIYENQTNFDIKFQRNYGKKVGIFDQYLKKFQYKKALVQSFSKKNMSIVMAIIDQFIQRGCLDRTLKSLNQNDLQIILPQVQKLISNVKYSKSIIYFLQKLVDSKHDSPKELGQISKLYNSIQKQLQTIERLNYVDGMLNLVQNYFN